MKYVGDNLQVEIKMIYQWIGYILVPPFWYGTILVPLADLE